MSTTPTPEAPSPELLRMHNAGQLLANCAFNIAQHAGEPVSESVAATLKQYQSEWDAACLAFKTARAALTQGAGDCPRCQGSGEDPEGFFDQSRGPDGATHDGPCRTCGGSGGAGAVEPVATVVSWTNSSYSRNYKLTWHKDVPEGAKLYPAPPAQQLQQAVARAVEDMCARIKAADDAAADADYMLDSDDCIKVLRGEWQTDAAAIRAKGTHDQ